MVCVPRLRVEVAKVAWPEAFSVLVPSVVAPSRNVTVPPGVPAPGALAVTVAVNVTACPNTEGLAEAVTIVLVPSALTVCASAADVLVLKLVSPPYTAVIECAPTPSVELVNVACPAPFSVPVPSVVEPSRNVTVPVGAPTPGGFALTVAVNVAACPNTDGLADELSVVVVLTLLTTWDTPAEVLGLNLPSPPYTAVIVLVPAEVDASEQLPEPPASAPIVQVAPVPSLTVTEPVGVPPPGGTVTETATVYA
jgi:hypothetical protein